MVAEPVRAVRKTALAWIMIPKSEKAVGLPLGPVKLLPRIMVSVDH